jgi:phenylalanyl-tRNA synthetase alpha chain
VTTISSDQLARDLAIRDLTDPAAGGHAIQLLIDLAVAALTAAWDCHVYLARGPRVVSLADNYDALGFPPDAVTRDSRYTRYVDRDHMLRSHATAMIPAALRSLSDGGPEDILIVCPGITYRRDAIDRLHSGTPHQLDLWRIARHVLGEEDLEEMIRLLADALFPGRSYRWEPRCHPYTLNGRQVDVDADGEWVEVWECGLAHPDVLAGAGLARWTGLALGMGLDRLLMLRKGIPDIRLLRASDPRVASQMSDLAGYRAVSDLPSIRRDLSLAVPEPEAAEDLGDRVREALGDDADLIEEVAVLSETSYEALPRAALDRLGLAPGQKNVLVRLVIRPFHQTLSGQAHKFANVFVGGPPLRRQGEDPWPAAGP